MKIPDDLKRAVRHFNNEKRKHFSKKEKPLEINIKRKHTPVTAKKENINIITIRGTNQRFKVTHS